MTIFLRLLGEKDKAEQLLISCSSLRANEADARVFRVESESFRAVPGMPFAYWVSQSVRNAFKDLPPLEGPRRAARQGGVNGDDFRWLRLWFEPHNVASKESGCVGVPIAKGGSFSGYYADIYLVARWNTEQKTFDSFNGLPHRPSLQPASAGYYFRPGLTWPRRTNGFSVRALPAGCIFADKGPAIFVKDDNLEELLSLSAILNSRAFWLLISLQLARTELAQSFEVGLIQKTPVPNLSPDQQAEVAGLARRAWSFKRMLDTVEETSHAFDLPAVLRVRMGDYDPLAIEAELARIRAEIDVIAFELYGFAEEDRPSVRGANAAGPAGEAEDGEPGDDSDGEDDTPPADQTTSLLSWAVGVAFGRFDLRRATGERAASLEPDPFDPLPAKSPGMVPDGDAPFHAHPGILVDDPGHPHDLTRLIEDVLARVNCPVRGDVRRFLERDFFPFHMRRYSKSHRKAPIYWPLSTASGNFTLWLYYPNLTSQTLYSAVNDFLEPKLKDLPKQIAALRTRGDARTRDETKALGALQELEQELIELRDALLRIAPTYQPNHDDGVQIVAAPLWPLFRHKPWQKLLKETWDKLENGDYDWAHLAMAYWPARVQKKCEIDRSLAIAHDLEDLYKPPPEVQNRTTRQRKRKSREAEAP